MILLNVLNSELNLDIKVSCRLVHNFLFSQVEQTLQIDFIPFFSHETGQTCVFIKLVTRADMNGQAVIRHGINQSGSPLPLMLNPSLQLY